MTYNISFQICAIVLVVMIMLLFFRHKTLRRSNEMAFSILLVSIFFCVTLDLTSIVAIHSLAQTSLLCIAACKLYLLSIIFVAYALVLYTLIEIYRNPDMQLRLFIFFLLPLLIGVWSYITLPIYIYTDETQLYTYGPCVNITYAIAVVYLFICLFYVASFRKQINRNRLASICFLILAWLTTAMIQFIRNELLLISFSMGVAAVFMYLKLENPDENLDQSTETFNSHAFASYLFYLDQGNTSYSIITVVLDDYRFLVETFGYRNSKMLLRSIADFLNYQSGGRVFRSGENDFSIIFLDENQMQTALPVIRERFSGTWNVSNLSMELSVSLCYMPDSQVLSYIGDSYELIRYFITQSRKAGKRSLTCIDSTAIEQKLTQDRAESALRNAIIHETVQVYYQPIYSTELNRYSSAEALVRIYDEHGDFVSPEVFIPIAEQNGLILQLGEIIFEQVCSFLHDNDLASRGIEYIEVNLSVVQCMKESLASDLKAIMDHYEVPYSMINLEITETAAVNSADTLLNNMERLRSLGVTFSLDDYGSGYSNLNYIIGLPVQIAKLDKQLIWSYFESSKAKVAANFSISMLRHLGLRLVAEGVETQEQLQELLRLKIDYIQGFYYSKPLPGREFLIALDKQL